VVGPFVSCGRVGGWGVCGFLVTEIVGPAVAGASVPWFGPEVAGAGVFGKCVGTCVPCGTVGG